MVDLIGLVGFDAVWIENEHSDFTSAQISQMILAARSRNMDALVRVTRCGYTEIIKPLEAGASGVVVPHCTSGTDAAAIVRDAKFAPLGMRGAGGGVDSDYGNHDYLEYAQHANAQTMVAVLIEDKQAVDNIDAIAATAGVDLLLLGPYDLSQSYGVFGQIESTPVLKAIDALADACARHGKHWGLPISDRAHAQKMLKRGARVLQLKNDQQVLQSGFRAMKQTFADISY